MPDSATTIESVSLLDRPQAASLAAAENERFVDLVRSLDADDWTRPTDCPAWDVRAMVAHVLGAMESIVSPRELVHQIRAGGRAAGGRPLIDGMTEVQVAERAHLSTSLLVERLVATAPRAARARRRLPAPLRRLPFKSDVAGVTETWALGFLYDVIYTRDTWMHRVDIARATGRPSVLTPDHDGRIVADVVAEWARRHGRPFRLHLHGPAGGAFIGGDGDGEEITLDAVEFCRILSGRGEGTGLLTQPVPF
ncbi:maleylpyruvate isomerase family mycothiol-dependent enzyme [Microtetraspora malaysiensis]|uniref:maleylpyruvate isomerase family mycothiol-dependent enzyme n=1 Tax=Microtetraspora malaysiensis TaxID=161358 RepID=UPI000830901B|nr:maleylpyruvate isomerase family mycothiol-dependent enzyme [Microtetraspora malaysiensis]